MRLLLVPVLLLAAGCLPKAGPSLQAQEPTRRVPAIKDASVGQPDEVAALIEALDDDDAVVRLTAVNRLRDLTGESFGYEYWDAPADRTAAIQRWKDWAEGGR